MSESSQSNTPDPPRRFFRVWHRSKQDWCHAWDVEESAFRLWRDAKGVLSSRSVFLPNGQHPKIGTQVVCGTCGSPGVIPPEAKVEFMTT